MNKWWQNLNFSVKTILNIKSLITISATSVTNLCDVFLRLVEDIRWLLSRPDATHSQQHGGETTWRQSAKNDLVWDLIFCKMVGQHRRAETRCCQEVRLLSVVNILPSSSVGVIYGFINCSVHTQVWCKQDVEEFWSHFN